MKYILAALILFSSPAFAAETLSLSAARGEAENNSPDLKRLKSVAEKTSWEKLGALSGYIPHISASYDHFLSSNYMQENILFGGAVVGFPAAYPQDNVMIDATWTVFDGLGSYNHYRAASQKTDAAELDVQHAKFMLDHAVSIAFYEALAAQKLLDVAKQNVMTLQQHLDRAKLTARNGYGTRFDVLRIEATLQESLADQEQALNNAQTSREALQVAMGIDGTDTRPLEGELPVLKAEDVPPSLEPEIMNRDDIRAQILRADAAHSESKASDAYWFPSVSLFAEQNYYKFGDFSAAVQSNPSFQSASAVGIRLKWNIFDGGLSYSQSQRAAASEFEERQVTEKKRISAPKEVTQWKRSFLYNASLYNARLKSVAQFEESVRLASIGVKAGSNTHTEMLDAELDLFRARAGLVRAQEQMIESFEKLEMALGKPLASAAK